MDDDKEYSVIDMNGKDFGLVFSHNINGETHPCGCRNFPLGGIPQVAGQLEILKKDRDIIFVDTGDTLFDTPTLTSNVIKSKKEVARFIAKSMDEMGLQYWVPGDQDFAAGIPFLREVLEEAKFKMLVSNLKEPENIKHKEFVVLKKGPHRIFLAGMVHPDLLSNEYAHLFTYPKTFMPRLLEKIKEHGYQANNQFHRLILLSHSGIENDKKLVTQYRNFDWIVGAHSMNFLRKPEVEGNTKLVQVLSRNHYIGEVAFNIEKSKSADTYHIHEIRDEKQKGLMPNPYIEKLAAHKQLLLKIREEEEKNMMGEGMVNVHMLTANQCIDCHTPQADFWKGTSHSLAWATLINAQEHNNPECIRCHSVGFKEKNGFSKSDDVVFLDGEEFDTSEHMKLAKEKYLDEVKKAFGGLRNIRSLSKGRILHYSKKWHELDQKYKVVANHANVQCLNCHQMHIEHPFGGKRPTLTQTQKMERQKGLCIKCHDPDQSPEWYLKTESGLAGKINDAHVEKMIYKMACPPLQTTN
jgi:nitrate/TMAO reductase-like tetraheme cytochrome c subunit